MNLESSTSQQELAVANMAEKRAAEDKARELAELEVSRTDIHTHIKAHLHREKTL